MRFRVMGPLEVRHDGGDLDIGGRQPRLVLSVLLAADGAPVTPGTLTDLLWGECPPTSSAGTLQTYVSRLRRTLATAGLRDPAIVLDRAGYRLPIDADDLDAACFERLLLAAEATVGSDPEHAAGLLDEALALVRGPVWSELTSVADLAPVAHRLEERIVGARELRTEAALRLGRHGSVLDELTALVVAHPLRERARALLAVALYRSERQVDALTVLSDGAKLLREELGVEPSPRLQELEQQILRHDPVLDAPGRGQPPTTTGGGASLRPDAPTQPAIVTPLVGRRSELDQLRAALEEAGGDARFVVIEGDPGIGKTRLADELRAIAVAAGSTAIWGRADESGAAPALWPWLPILRALDVVGGAQDLTGVAASDTPAVPGHGTSVRYERFEAVAVRLEEVGDQRPVVVLLDDLQWADETSLDLLAFLVPRLHRGVLVVSTVRTEGADLAEPVANVLATIARRAGSRRIVLSGLSRADIGELLPPVCGDPLLDDLADVIHERSEGNPFYALELGRLWADAGEAAQAIPATVRDVIRRRLRQLPQRTYELLALGAIMGRDIDVNLLASAARVEPGECADLLEAALVHRVLVEIDDRPGHLRFHHALIREVLVDAQTSLQRARLHLQAADALETIGRRADDAELLADHLWHSVAIAGPERAAEALEHAAEIAVTRVAWTSAERLLRRAARLRRSMASDDVGRKAELATLVRFLEVSLATRYFSGIDQTVVARAEQLATEAGDERLSHVLFWFRWAALSVGTVTDEAMTLALEFDARYATDERPVVRAFADDIVGTALWAHGRIVEAAARFDRAAANFQGVDALDALEVEQWLVTHTFRYFMHAMIGDWTPAQVFDGYQTLLREWPETAKPSICGFAATAACALGDWTEVRRYCDLAEQADPAAQFAFWRGQFMMQRAIADAAVGDVAGALDRFVEGRDLYLSLAARSAIPTFGATLARHLVEHGRLDEARVLVVDARERLDAWNERWCEPFVLMGEGAVAASSGDHEGAARSFDEAARTAGVQGSNAVVPQVRALARRHLGVAGVPA